LQSALTQGQVMIVQGGFQILDRHAPANGCNHRTILIPG
jgi:hypothetical protein